MLLPLHTANDLVGLVSCGAARGLLASCVALGAGFCKVRPLLRTITRTYVRFQKLLDAI